MDRAEAVSVLERCLTECVDCMTCGKHDKALQAAMEAMQEQCNALQPYSCGERKEDRP